MLERRVAEATGVEAADIEPAEVTIKGGGAARGPDLDATDDDDEGDAGQAQNTPQANALRVAEKASSASFEAETYVCITDLSDLEQWIEKARQEGVVAFDTETDSLDANQANLVGFSLSHKAGEAAYVPLQHNDGEDDLLGGGGILPGQRIILAPHFPNIIPR